LIVELRANCAKAGSVDLVGLPILRTDKALASQLLKDVERAVRQQEAIAGIAIDRGNVAGLIAAVHNTTALGEDV